LQSDFAASEEIDTERPRATLRDRNCNEYKGEDAAACMRVAYGSFANGWAMVPIATGRDEEEERMSERRVRE
jgi:hypothetical protein